MCKHQVTLFELLFTRWNDRSTSSSTEGIDVTEKGNEVYSVHETDADLSTRTDLVGGKVLKGDSFGRRLRRHDTEGR